MSGIQLQDLDLTLEDVKTMLRRHYELNGTKKCPKINEIVIRTLGDVPAGIMSSHFIITVTLEDVNENETTWSCFVKRTPKDDFGSKYAEDLETFDKEGNIYQKLIPALQEIAKGRTPWTAVCYLTKGIDLIALDNLTLQGFVPSISGRLLDFDHLSVVMKALARMNAASIALEVKHSKPLTEIFPNLLRENGYPTTNTPGYRQLGVQSFTKTVQHFVKLLSAEGKVKYEKFSTEELVEMVPKIMQELFELVKPSTKFRNVFNQSDLWANNILFKYENNEKVVDCRLVDFQFSRYAPPMYDICTLLLTSTPRKFKEDNVEALLDLYFASLTNEMSIFGLQAEQYLTRKELSDSFKVYNKAALIESLCFFQTIYLPEEKWSDLVKTPQTFEDFVLNKHTEICSKVFETHAGYRNKITEIIQELLDVSLLSQ
ncbi:uncharacterized protein LOC134832912 [Culicoides brevitarsis]|uniref:uncharacterized protein LOC134832912 n=1 Tax=Culicoides brevitarsis TaxID=469753 RepID=UPI00307BF797